MQGHPLVYTKFEVKMGSMTLCLKNKEGKTDRQIVGQKEGRCFLVIRFLKLGSKILAVNKEMELRKGMNVNFFHCQNCLLIFLSFFS